MEHWDKNYHVNSYYQEMFVFGVTILNSVVTLGEGRI